MSTIHVDDGDGGDGDDDDEGQVASPLLLANPSIRFFGRLQREAASGQRPGFIEPSQIKNTHTLASCQQGLYKETKMIRDPQENRITLVPNSGFVFLSALCPWKELQILRAFWCCLLGVNNLKNFWIQIQISKCISRFWKYSDVVYLRFGNVCWQSWSLVSSRKFKCKEWDWEFTKLHNFPATPHVGRIKKQYHKISQIEHLEEKKTFVVGFLSTSLELCPLKIIHEVIQRNAN